MSVSRWLSTFSDRKSTQQITVACSHDVTPLGDLWLARARARGLAGLKKLRSSTRSRTASKQRAAI